MANQVSVDDTKGKEELSNVSVILDDKGNPIQSETPKKEAKYITEEMLANTVSEAIKKATAPLYYELRKTKEQPVYQQPAPVKPATPPTEWDEKLQKDWKGTVEELADARVNQILERQAQTQRAEYDRQQSFQLLENNKKKVLERHKELNDETSSKANVYREILQEHPEYLNNPFGPVLAMRDMEDRLKENGVVDDTTRQTVQREAQRIVRTNASSIPSGQSSATKGKSVTLTKEQKEYCDLKGIKYENYARYATQSEKRNGVEA